MGKCATAHHSPELRRFFREICRLNNKFNMLTISKILPPLEGVDWTKYACSALKSCCRQLR